MATFASCDGMAEPALENWGIRGGQAACDVELGFKIDV